MFKILLSNESLFLVVIIAPVLVVTAIAVWVTLRRREERAQELKQLAFRMSLSFKAEDRMTDSGFLSLPRLSALILSKSSGVSYFPVWNVMRKSIDDQEMILFDCGIDKASYTFAAFRFPSRVFPRFALRPHNVTSNILIHLSLPLGYKDVHFPARAQFSKNYILRGNDPDSIQSLFKEEVLRFFEEEQFWSADGAAEWLLVGKEDPQKGSRLTPDEIPSFLHAALNVMQLFAQ